MENQSPEFCVGVRILLSRMDSHPEEFVGSVGTKWSTLFDNICSRKQKGSTVFAGNFTAALTDA